MQLEYVLVPLIAVIVIIYGVLGGLTAAYWTDMVQGIFHHHPFGPVGSIWVEGIGRSIRGSDD